MTASEYKNLFLNLNVNRNGNKIAPHKAILLLTVIDMVEKGILKTPYIPLSDKLYNSFNNIWRHYVSPSSCFSCKLNYPFFHLSSSPFWKLKKLDTYEQKKEYSMAALKRSFSGATIDLDLFELLKQPDFRNEIRGILIASFINKSINQNISHISSILIVTISILSIA